MSTLNSTYCYGTAAVKIDVPHLVLLEGGAAHSAAASGRKASAKPLGLLGVLVCVAVASCIAIGAAYVQDRNSSAIFQALSQAPVSEHVIHDGETIWQIAEHCDVPGVPTKDLVDWIIKENDLGGGLVSVGQRIAVPQGQASLR